MAALTSFLKVTVLGDSKPMTSAMRKAMRELQQVENGIKKMSGNINRAMGAMGIGLGVSGLANMARNAEASQKSLAKLGAVTSSMALFGSATDDVVTRLDEYAVAQGRRLGLDKDVIRQTQTSLMTFKEIASSADVAGGAFDRATMAAIDLAAAGFGTAEGNAIQLGKALNDPIKGLAALSESGITFTEQEKKKIAQLVKSNKTLEAQDLILQAIEAQVSGTAEAGTTSFGKLGVIFDELTETLGSYILPYIEAFADWLVSDDGQEKLQMLADGFGMIFTNLANIISFLSDNTWIVGTIAGLYALVKVWQLINKVMKVAYAITKGNTIAQMALKAVTGSVGIGAIVAGVAAVGAGLLAFMAIDSLLGGTDDSGTVVVPKAKKLELPEVKQFKRDELDDINDKDKKNTRGLKKAESALVAAIKTVQTKLAEVRKAILDMAVKFYQSVELGFGLLDRGASKVFRADRYVRELKRMQGALADYQTNLAKLQALGGAAATPLLQQILGMSPEEGAAILRGFANSPDLFNEALSATQGLAVTGARVGVSASALAGNQPVAEMVNEIKLLRGELKAGKNTYNIKATMSANEIINQIRAWEKSTGKTVLAG